MSKEKIVKQLKEYKDWLEAKGYDVVYIGLYGSQNYNLDDDYSDIDARAVVLPTLKQLVTNGSVSKVYRFDEGEVDVKDIPNFMTNLSKGNPAYVETVETSYYLGDEDFLALCQGFKINPKAVLGMMKEKKAAIEKGLPKSSPMIEKIGYDPKQLHHIIRLSEMPLRKVNRRGPYERQKMIDIKRKGVGTKEVALLLADRYIEDFFWDNDYERTPIKDEVFEYIEAKMKEVLLRENYGRFNIGDKIVIDGYMGLFTGYIASDDGTDYLPYCVVQSKEDVGLPLDELMHRYGHVDYASNFRIYSREEMERASYA